MDVVLWDTRRNFALKDQPGWPTTTVANGGLFRSRRPDRYPHSAKFATLNDLLKRCGHKVELVEDSLPPADAYFFNPCLATLAIERDLICHLYRARPQGSIFVFGALASWFPELLSDLPITILSGPIQNGGELVRDLGQLHEGTIRLGGMSSSIPESTQWGDWSGFDAEKYRVAAEFMSEPVGILNLADWLQTRMQSHGSVSSVTLCEALVSGLEYLGGQHGFKSFRVNLPIGLNNQRLLSQIAESILLRGVRGEYSLALRSDKVELLGYEPELFRLARASGLASIILELDDPRFECPNAFLKTISSLVRLGIRVQPVVHCQLTANQLERRLGRKAWNQFTQLNVVLATKVNCAASSSDKATRFDRPAAESSPETHTRSSLRIDTAASLRFCPHQSTFSITTQMT